MISWNKQSSQKFLLNLVKVIFVKLLEKRKKNTRCEDNGNNIVDNNQIIYKAELEKYIFLSMNILQLWL